MAISLESPSTFQLSLLLKKLYREVEGKDADSLTVKSIGKLGAVTPHAQFEEREQKTGSGQAGLRRQARNYCQ